MAVSGLRATVLEGALRLLPPRLAGAGAALLLRRMGRAHPALLRGLRDLPPARLHIEVTDLGYGFLLRLGGTPRIAVVPRGRPPAEARIRGRLDSLIGLLEGRLDSDALFFSRAITIEGDSAVVVGLHNRIDRDRIDLGAELAALFGPLAGPARAAGRRLQAIAGRAHTRLIAAHRALHEADPSAAIPGAIPDVTAAEIGALRAGLDRLARRLARLERRRNAEPAARTPEENTPEEDGR